MKILDFIYAKIEEWYVRRGYSYELAVKYMYVVLGFALFPLIVIIMMCISEIVPAGDVAAGIAVGVVFGPTFIFTYLKYGRIPDGYYNDVLDEFPKANKRIKGWMVFFLPFFFLLFWLTLGWLCSMLL